MKKLKEKYYQKSGRVIFSGELEKIIENKNNKYQKLRENLIWENSRYGKNIKRRIHFPNRIWFKNPIFFQGTGKWNKEVFDYLSEYVHFSKIDREIFKKLNSKK